MNDAPDTRLSLIGKLHDHANADAWTEFVQLYQPLILAIATRRGLQHADATEVTQEVLGRVSRSIESWNPDPNRGSFRGWLYHITQNLTVDHLRRRQRRGEHFGERDLDQLAAATVDESHEFRIEFERRLFHWAAESVKTGFSEDNWQAFWMTTVQDVPIQQAADRLGITRGKVYVARSRVMARIATVIRQRLDETCTDEDISSFDVRGTNE